MINTGAIRKDNFYYLHLKIPNILRLLKRDFFQFQEVDLLIAISKQYYNKFKKSPSKDQLWMIITTKELEDRCAKIFFEELFKKELKDYDIDWVEETARSWIKWKHLDSSIVDTR